MSFMRLGTDDREDETVSFDDVYAEHETERALLCVIDGEKHWIPKSCVSDDSFVWEKGQRGTLVITEWIAKERNLI